ncbi:helix-turn-helix domain-containing protein [Kitasatospora purpeofusca]|uniref:helix-turn-helix domain-containing protein n=1 Tax=Kitasatospora purpeofusca TaxID=67352 RepID=UPI0035DCD589
MPSPQPPQFRFDANRFEELAARAGDTTRYAISRRTGLTQGAISNILTGRRQPTLNSAMRLTQPYGISLDDLVSVAA